MRVRRASAFANEVRAAYFGQREEDIGVSTGWSNLDEYYRVSGPAAQCQSSDEPAWHRSCGAAVSTGKAAQQESIAISSGGLRGTAEPCSGPCFSLEADAASQLPL